jgi:hypothetical protein
MTPKKKRFGRRMWGYKPPYGDLIVRKYVKSLEQNHGSGGSHFPVLVLSLDAESKAAMREAVAEAIYRQVNKSGGYTYMEQADAVIARLLKGV